MGHAAEFAVQENEVAKHLARFFMEREFFLEEDEFEFADLSIQKEEDEAFGFLGGHEVVSE